VGIAISIPIYKAGAVQTGQRIKNPSLSVQPGHPVSQLAVYPGSTHLLAFQITAGTSPNLLQELGDHSLILPLIVVQDHVPATVGITGKDLVSALARNHGPHAIVLHELAQQVLAYAVRIGERHFGMPERMFIIVCKVVGADAK